MHNSVISVKSASFRRQVSSDFLLAITTLLQALNRGSSALGLQRVQLPLLIYIYNLWKQSMREIAASLAISGSICLPTGVDLSTLKFCRSVLQCWFALIAVTSKSYLN
jgi:ABC-type proline/glycine betaine transport system permease subunit